MLLDAGVPPDAYDAEGSCTPLMLAAHAGARKTLSALLEASDVSARDASRVTLQAAAAGGRAKALRLLLAAGAAANVTDDVGSSAAFYAARAGSRLPAGAPRGGW